MQDAPAGPGTDDPGRTADPGRAHAWLAWAVRNGLVFVGVNMRIMARPGAPAFRRYETMIPSFVGAAGVIGAVAIGGFVLGIVMLTVSLAAWFLVLWPRVRDRVYDRTLTAILSDQGAFEQAWRMGAINLSHRTGGECRSPDGHWPSWIAGLPDEAPPPPETKA